MKRRSRARGPRIEVDLMMECVDDDLSPWQIEANKRAEAEYKDALNRIQAAKAAAVALASVPPVENSVTRTNVGRPPPSDSPDVIIVDETPAPRLTKKALPSVPAGNKAPAIKSPGSKQPVVFTPSMGPHGQPILLPNQSFSQYQIIQTVGGQAQIVTRPVVGRTMQSGGQMLNVIQTGIPIQRVSAQPRKPNEVTPVTGTHGLGVKRTSPGSGAVEPARKRQAARRQSTEKDEAGNWVPLDEYYYGKKEGDPAYREEKAEFRFKCWYCHKMLYNNLRIMMHMQGHIDSEKQQNLDLSDLTQCKHCYKQFDTPFEMQCHIEKVHQKQSNVLVCRICEKDHDSQTGLRTHMRAYHNACEMPYICQLCNFRSSIFSDVVDHFKKRHDSSQYMMCLYCLRVFKINFSKSSGWGLTQNYYQHLQKHQLKNSCRKCPCCKLTFVNKADAKLHRSKDHLPNYKGILGAGAGTMTTTTEDQEQVMIKVPEKKSNQLKSLNAPVSSKVRALGGVQFRNQLRDLHCFECGNVMGTQDHYKKYVECSMCRFATTCNYSYMNHMTGFHSGIQAARMASVPRERPLKQVMYCLCGYSSKYGNVIANHLVSCSKRTSYTNKPEMRWFEYDDEQEEFNPFEPYIEEPDTPETESPKKDKEITLFDALGLVKRAPKPGQQNQGTPKQDTDPLQIVDAPQPADDEIPAELTGGKTRSTVKLPEPEAPSKKSIYLGFKMDKRKKNKKSVDDSSKDSSVASEQTIEDKSSDNSLQEKVTTSKTQDLTPEENSESTHTVDGEESDETKSPDQDKQGVSEIKSSENENKATKKSSSDSDGGDSIGDTVEDQPDKQLDRIDEADCDNLEQGTTPVQTETNSAAREVENMEVESTLEEPINVDATSESSDSKVDDEVEKLGAKSVAEKSSIEVIQESDKQHDTVETENRKVDEDEQSVSQANEKQIDNVQTETAPMNVDSEVDDIAALEDQEIADEEEKSFKSANQEIQKQDTTVLEKDKNLSESEESNVEQTDKLEPEVMDNQDIAKTEDNNEVTETGDKDIANPEDKEVAETEDKYMAEIEDKKNVVETKDNKDIAEIEDNKDIVETENIKDIAEIEDNKDIVEIEDNKDIVEIEDNKDIAETEDIKDIVETEDNKDIIETEDIKDIADTEDNKDIVAIEDNKDIAETEDIKDIVETEDNKDVTQADDKQGVEESEDKEYLTESESTSQGKETVTDMEDEEAVTESVEKETDSDAGKEEILIKASEDQDKNTADNSTPIEDSKDGQSSDNPTPDDGKATSPSCSQVAPTPETMSNSGKEDKTQERTETHSSRPADPDPRDSRQGNHQKSGGSRDDDRRRDQQRRDQYRREDYRRDDHRQKQDSHYPRDRDHYRRDDRYHGNRDYDQRHGGGYGGRYNDRHGDRQGGYRDNHGGGNYHRNDWRDNRGGRRGRGGYYGRGGHGGYY